MIWNIDVKIFQAIEFRDSNYWEKISEFQRMNSRTEFVNPRKVNKVVLAREQYEGDGAIVRRSIGRYRLHFGSNFSALRLYVKLLKILYSSVFVTAQSWNFWTPFCFWMNSQVGSAHSLPKALLTSMVEFYLRNQICLCIAVSAPGGFPDHPHRGKLYVPCFGFSEAKISDNCNHLLNKMFSLLKCILFCHFGQVLKQWHTYWRYKSCFCFLWRHNIL